MSSIRLALVESVRYRGKIGQYSWLFHRLSGLGILTFLIIHVWDTANATFWPEMYSFTVEIFKWIPFFFLEIGLMAFILFHAFNGLRITLLDFKPAWWKHQEMSARLVWGAFVVTYVPIAALMTSSTLAHCRELAAVGGSCFRPPSAPGLTVNTTVVVVGLLALAGGAVVWFIGRRPAGDAPSRPDRPRIFGTDLERFAYLFMRLSGISLLLLAVGHMLLQHVFRDVHALTLSVVADVWRSWGWRAYDLFLLGFAATHGFNGLRHVLEDYVHDPKTMRGINRALVIFLVITVIWAGIAIFSFQPDAVMVTAP